ncbi:MAG: M48 family metallopeptidase [Candidatus Thiodiazotropha sp. (ex Dulcina madagascariensis)]|nr:M48 family metallopeptidase [Candidatus Thiodiazotropha sp. (ex Dulcina madagascariensis)]MCU7925490.1 M48 family metallopeptidase [Candidatus Thiodiazotropha sp. (ex Dulcina madagascariensis)]
MSKMTQRVIEQMELPEEMAVQMHYSTDTTINAYATLGGNVILFRGLMEKLPHENALAMLIAHEIAHIKHRDPITGLGSGIAIQLFLAVVLGRTEASILGEAGVYTMLHFSRSMEGSADTAALQALHRLYGHTTGATSLFEVIQAERKKMGIELPAFFQSHPLDQERIDRIQQISRQNGWSQNSETTPLPKDFERWLKVSAGSEQ